MGGREKSAERSAKGAIGPPEHLQRVVVKFAGSMTGWSRQSFGGTLGGPTVAACARLIFSLAPPGGAPWPLENQTPTSRPPRPARRPASPAHVTSAPLRAPLAGAVVSSYN